MIKTFQVTLTGGVDQVSTQDILCQWYAMFNNAAANISLGDANLQPIVLTAGAGSNYQGWKGLGESNLKYWYAKGTNTQKLDVLYEDGQP